MVMFLWNYFTKVVCKVPSKLICLPSICDDNGPPSCTVCKSASSFFGVSAKILKHHTIYMLRNKLNYLIKGTG